MKIYTKTGDKGETSLFGGRRVAKDSLRIDAYGTIDELNSILGVCRSLNDQPEIDSVLERIQQDLFVVGSELAMDEISKKSSIRLISNEEVKSLEKYIDSFELKLVPLKNFILPGGNQTAATIHFARTVCRRAERLIVNLSHKEIIRELLLIYINRLSDLLFVIARLSNTLSKTPEIKWISE
ncbi:MAG: cob(I)yrinic acid a,c-diamide adenosyltransferase [Ignavibacteriales bacterium]|nr:cob(I)yrinic acid a,c-diamide adenosyltransferase [Ignavibacteriales bacterium]